MKIVSKIVLLAFLVSMLFAGCGGTGETNPSTDETAKVNFRISIKSQTKSSRATTSIATLVTGGTIRLQRGPLVKYATLTVTGGQATAQVDNLLIGNWHADVQLYDKDNQIIYSGSADFRVYKQETTQDIVITLTRHEGSALFVIDLPTENSELDPGLILWNKLGSAAEIAASAHGTNLVLHGSPSFVAGKFGNAMLCNDTDNYAAITGLPNMMNRGTISFWVAPQFDSDGNGISSEPHPTFIQKSPWAAPPNDVALEITYNNNSSLATYGNILFTIAGPVNGSQVYIRVPSGRLTFGVDQWMHVAASWDINGIDGTSDTMRLYIDGVMVGSSKVAFPLFERRLFDFGRNAPGTRSAHSKLDNLKIYNYAKATFDLVYE